MGTVISASRRTDIPRLYSEWFMRRVRAGYCVVANPFNARQLSRVSLDAEAVDAIVFWTKDPRPLMAHQADLDSRGYRYYFQYTLTDYPRSLEPGLASLETRVDTFRRLAGAVERERVIWRYDPIVLSEVTDYDYHRRAFEALAERLRGSTSRVVISVVDVYAHIESMLDQLGVWGLAPEEDIASRPAFQALVRDLAQSAESRGMEIVSCAEKVDLQPFGVSPGKCVDDDYIERVLGVVVSHKKDPGQRPECGCVESKDIGAYDTCTLGCTYCYATRSVASAQRRRAEHDPDSPSLVGWHDVVEERVVQQGRLL